ncbi:flagellar biosynthesis anti-sigma factor FlgM [Konateibacter massiliensis]|uniref:flagellar biosynthesis anti-sigma factor FlgM n=1 Tax=Konateibacter massiliensis TaxID=2002841 RepID=UPI000C150F35|nr:flagellar biosynthesis anti-sigma factor FlgM [Konateibacter massiliensis]
MRIEAYNQISQIYNTEKTKNVQQTAPKGKNDQLEISQKGLDYQIAKKAVAEADDVREELVNNIKSQIQSGDYNVSADDFASKVIASYEKLMY